MRRSIPSLAFAAIALWAACSPDAPKIVGTWRNRDKQILTVNPTLKGTVYQLTACAPPLAVDIHRDPYDAYAIQFEIDQTVYFPPAEASRFGGAQFFCSSSDSDPMCSFCRINGRSMTCMAPEQKISGFGATVMHDCNWTQLSTSPTSSITASYDAGISCGFAPDGGGCTALLETEDTGPTPKDAAADAGVADTGSTGGDS